MKGKQEVNAVSGFSNSSENEPTGKLQQAVLETNMFVNKIKGTSGKSRADVGWTVTGWDDCVSSTQRPRAQTAVITPIKLQAENLIRDLSSS